MFIGRIYGKIMQLTICSLWKKSLNYYLSLDVHDNIKKTACGPETNMALAHMQEKYHKNDMFIIIRFASIRKDKIYNFIFVYY